MTNASQYQREYWYSRLVAKNDNMEFCELCGKIKYVETPTGIIQNDIMLIVDRIDNTNNHSITSSSLDDFQLLCKPCNARKNPPKKPKDFFEYPSERPASREKSDRIKYEPAYHQNLRNLLIQKEHLCLKEVEMAASYLSNGGSIPTCQRYLYSQYKTIVNPKGLYQRFPYSCNSEHCTNTHICLVGMKPQTLIQTEENTLRQEWQSKYGDHRDTWHSSTSTVLKPFMELDEYFIANGKLLNHVWL